MKVCVVYNNTLFWVVEFIPIIKFQHDCTTSLVQYLVSSDMLKKIKHESMNNINQFNADASRPNPPLPLVQTLHFLRHTNDTSFNYSV